jgi:membrane fusion protein, multidrug efflux system
MCMHEMKDRVDFRSEMGKGFSRFVPAVLLLVLAAALISGCSKGEKPAPPAPDVEVVQVMQKDVPIYSEWVGSLDGMVNATIRAQVQGYLIRQNYQEGGFVKKGQVLFEIDPRTFQATYDQAKARWNQASANLKRIKPLAAQNAVSQKDLDDAIGNEQSTKAEFDKAALNLDFTKITSPIDGIAGMAKAQMGNLVGPGQIEELTTVSTVNPIKVYASVSEQEYLKLLDIKAEREKDKLGKVPLELILANGSTYPLKGEVAFADRQIDERTGTMKVASLFPNPDSMLRPGQFARVRALLEVKKNALIVPQRALKEVQGKFMAALVGADNKVTIKEVEAGEKVGPFWVINAGLKPGDRVVAEGLQKIKEGLVVNPKPFNLESLSMPGEEQKPAAQPENKQKQEAMPATQPKPEKGESHG